jgi:hypothetical protein
MSMSCYCDPTSPTVAEAFSRDLQAAGHALGVQLHVQHASTEGDLDTVFADLGVVLNLLRERLSAE